MHCTRPLLTKSRHRNGSPAFALLPRDSETIQCLQHFLRRRSALHGAAPDPRGIFPYRLIDEVGEETRAHPVCIIGKRWLRSQEVANWRLDWRQHRSRQRTENDCVDSGGLALRNVRL
jgi:hypothetical protein